MPVRSTGSSVIRVVGHLNCMALVCSPAPRVVDEGKLAVCSRTLHQALGMVILPNQYLGIQLWEVKAKNTWARNLREVIESVLSKLAGFHVFSHRTAQGPRVREMGEEGSYTHGGVNKEWNRIEYNSLTACPRIPSSVAAGLNFECGPPDSVICV